MIPQAAVDALQLQAERPTFAAPVFMQEHQGVSLMFADIVGATRCSTSHTPAATMQLLHTLFCQYDDVCQCLHLYKVETIGDCFMVAAGLVRNRAQSASALLCLLAGCMFVLKANEVSDGEGGHLQVRIGIHTGDVTSGVISKLRPRYDVYGETVNLASRMESTADVGHVQISDATMAHLPPEARQLPWRTRTVEVKGKGEMTTHTLLPNEFPVDLFGRVLMTLHEENAVQSPV